jgi:alpha-D-ribose 1-methylphosphonate 5-triphosphate diphosphatase
MWLTDARLVLPDRVMRGSLRLEDGLIVEIVEDRPARATGYVVDLRGMTLMPGIVDIHGDMIERELEPRPGTFFPVELALQQLDARLAANGITTAYAAIALADGPGLRSEERARSLIGAVNAARPHLNVDMRVHARFEVSLPSGTVLLADGLERDEIHMVSLMDHTPGQGQFRDLETYIEYMTRWLGGDRDKARETAKTGLEMPVSWDVAHEIARLAQSRGVPLASHDDDTADKVGLMHSLGTTISEFPVSLDAALAAKSHGMFVAMGAPNAFRGGSHSGNLSALEAIHNGAVDLLCADYHPASLVQSAFKLSQDGVLPLEDSVKLIAENAARSAGLTDRGRLELGLRADLCIVEIDSAHGFPRVRTTIRQGRVIHSDGTLHQLETREASFATD